MKVYVHDIETLVLKAELTSVIDIAKSEVGYSILIVKDKPEVMKFGKDVFLIVHIIYNEKENENVD